jgi:hypothetical protein
MHVRNLYGNFSLLVCKHVRSVHTAEEDHCMQLMHNYDSLYIYMYIETITHILKDTTVCVHLSCIPTRARAHTHTNV